ncbi:MAG: hypothetical protein A3C44_01130 [Gammaproteobacteria bacterium RIFCSPHIGHO2_02_FULL_39_13]|nr:MAG: hypothetical protein A3C44_01130 [Gammaproteobacteria bacterium RIFCSPHIGHO2_02_FULL_39_13]OGT48533.1 MAG: hypothetical protein A3E53_04055 [Gammaproteobacteria bacterium RIFCSPHIGHO2_12_FULL_39_24]
MTTLTVCILTAGRGSRMGEMGKILNKALFPINGKAIISHIISQFPDSAEFVIGLGFYGEQVKNYLQIAHNNKKFIFQEIDNFDKPGSGPGYSLLCCKAQLQKPFYFVSCDTLWNNAIDWNANHNWMGVDSVDQSVSKNYCNLKIVDRHVTALLDKETIPDNTYQAFVGLCFIQDYSIFFDALKNTETILGEHQISNGLKALIKKTTVNAQPIQWTDVGDEKKFKTMVSRYENYDFSKQDEALYFVNNKVIKFFSNALSAKQRVEKTKLNPSVFPVITDSIEQFYAYDFQTGNTLYQKNTPIIFKKLLKWLDEKLWIRQMISPTIMKSSCLNFYKEKTEKRITLYHKKYSNSDRTSKINNQIIPAMTDLIKKIPWEILCDGIPSFIHGDLHFDHTIFNLEKNTFSLIDWRQDFGGHVEFGDLYYDLAKMYGGIILNYDYIKLNLLTYSENQDEIFFDFAQRFQSKNYLEIFSDFIHKKGYYLDKIQLIVSLIYLNMSPLHHYPFDKMLYAMGRQMLYNQLNKMTMDCELI